VTLPMLYCWLCKTVLQLPPQYDSISYNILSININILVRRCVTNAHFLGSKWFFSSFIKETTGTFFHIMNSEPLRISKDNMKLQLPQEKAMCNSYSNWNELVTGYNSGWGDIEWPPPPSSHPKKKLSLKKKMSRPSGETMFFQKHPEMSPHPLLYPHNLRVSNMYIITLLSHFHFFFFFCNRNQ
jgi:hypothetical protein